MDAKTICKRKPAFNDGENLLIAHFYRDNVSIFQCSDTKANANSRKKGKYAELTSTINSSSLVKRTPHDVNERVKAVLRDTKQLPQAKKSVPTGGGPPLSGPPKEWMNVLLPIVLEHPCTTGIEGGIETGQNVILDETVIDGNFSGYESMSYPHQPSVFEDQHGVVETGKSCITSNAEGISTSSPKTKRFSQNETLL